MGTVKPAGKWVFRVFLVACVFGLLFWYRNRSKEVGKSQSLGQVAIPDAPEASLSGTAAKKLDLPSDKPAFNGGLKITHYEMAWQAQTAFNYANGGVKTTKGSLFDQVGLDIEIVRQDDCSASEQLFTKWIQDYHDGKTKDGIIVTYMGSGIPQYMHGIAEAVKALGPEYQPVAFVAWGKSFGEDQIIGDAAIKANPQLLRGKVCRGVRLDGDQDLIIKYCFDNGVPVNPNETTYDPEALNLSYAKDFLSAVVDYNGGQKETRKIVRNGKTAGDTTVGFDLVATWTPGDVNAIVNGKGGSTIISTKIYASVMPAIGITCKKFLNDNRDKMADLIGASATAADQIRSFEDVKKYACGLNAKIYNEQTPEYWYKYYNGVDQSKDAHLGGSMVYNLADMDKVFGLRSGTDVYREIYNTFSSLQSKLYPKDLPVVVDYAKAMDKSLMMSVVGAHPELLTGKPLQTQYAATITNKVTSKSVQVNFETGSAVVDPSSYPVLDGIYTSAMSAEGLKVGVYGHTDNTGSPEKNMALSESRAASVKKYLTDKGLPQERIESKGFGDTSPLAPNTTAAGKAKNRRVEIALGN